MYSCKYINYCRCSLTGSRNITLICMLYSVKTNIELVGSCCTLVTEMLLKAAFSISEQLCEMLYSKCHISLAFTI